MFVPLVESDDPELDKPKLKSSVIGDADEEEPPAGDPSESTYDAAVDEFVGVPVEASPNPSAALERDGTEETAPALRT